MVEVTDDLLDSLAESFLTRYRRGERPSLSEYTKQYPEFANQIQELFPALVELEELGSCARPDYPKDHRRAKPARRIPHRPRNRQRRHGCGL